MLLVLVGQSDVNSKEWLVKVFRFFLSTNTEDIVIENNNFSKSFI